MRTHTIFVTTINAERGYEFKRERDGYLRGFERREWKGEMMYVYYNLKKMQSHLS